MTRVHHFQRVVGPYMISTDPSLLDMPKMQQIVGNRYGSKISPLDVLQRAVGNSLNFGVYFVGEDYHVLTEKRHDFIGCTCVLTDYATICHEASRKRAWRLVDGNDFDAS